MNDLALILDLFGNSKETKLLICKAIFVWCLQRHRNGGLNSGQKSAIIVTDALIWYVRARFNNALSYINVFIIPHVHFQLFDWLISLATIWKVIWQMFLINQCWNLFQKWDIPYYKINIDLGFTSVYNVSSGWQSTMSPLKNVICV